MTEKRVGLETNMAPIVSFFVAVLVGVYFYNEVSEKIAENKVSNPPEVQPGPIYDWRFLALIPIACVVLWGSITLLQRYYWTEEGEEGETE